MWKITVYWWIKGSEERRKSGQDTFNSEKSMLPSEIDSAFDKMLNSEMEPRKQDFPNFYQASIAPRIIENWGITKVVAHKIKETVVQEKTEPTKQ